MDVRRLAAAARIAVGVGIAALTGGTGQVNAAPLDPPPPCPDCPADPGVLTNDPGGPPPAPLPLHPFTPQPPVMRVGPGGPKGGGGQPSYQQPLRPHPSPSPDQ
jgi:hypothetical protein